MEHISVFIALKRLSTSQKWFMLAAVLLILFTVYTVILSSGVFTYFTLYQEQWLLHRPLNGFNCVFREWKQLGEIGYSLFFTFLLCLACLFLKYRYRVLLYLFLLLLMGIGIEYIGKQQLAQPVPEGLRVGLDTLYCPQISNEPRSTRILISLGMWWQAPPVRPGRIRREEYGATTPIVIDEETPYTYSYPSGHAIRWCFLGLIACWLIWRHVRYRILRALLMVVALVIAFGGGFTLFYIGLHLFTDLIGGYLMGTALACCAIGLLTRNEDRGKSEKQSGQVDRQAVDALVS